ncbi:histidine phosphatase superfamily [Xylaria curta]|nr:histidine phosphatase superfamily [Xylaria curta]
MPPTIHIVCEAESRSTAPNGSPLRDPSLSNVGINQSRLIRNTFPYMNQVRAIVSSPLRRAIQTAQIAFEPILAPGLQITTSQVLLGLHGTPEFLGSPWEDLREEFGLDIDVRGLHNGWWYQAINDVHQFCAITATERARDARLRIRQVARELYDDDHIVVVTHRLFIGYLIGNIGDDFADGEYRSYQFINLWNENDNIAPLYMVNFPSASSSPGSNYWSQATPVDDQTSSDSSYNSQMNRNAVSSNSNHVPQVSLPGRSTNSFEVPSSSSSSSSEISSPGGPANPAEAPNNLGFICKTRAKRPINSVVEVSNNSGNPSHVSQVVSPEGPANPIQVSSNSPRGPISPASNSSSSSYAPSSGTSNGSSGAPGGSPSPAVDSNAGDWISRLRPRK